MRQKSVPEKEPATQVVKNIRRATRRHFSAEDKIRIVLEGLRGEDSIAELCRREGIVQNLYYRWSKDFLEAGKKRLPQRGVSMTEIDHWLERLYWVAMISVPLLYDLGWPHCVASQSNSIATN